MPSFLLVPKSKMDKLGTKMGRLIGLQDWANNYPYGSNSVLKGPNESNLDPFETNQICFKEKKNLI